MRLRYDIYPDWRSNSNTFNALKTSFSLDSSKHYAKTNHLVTTIGSNVSGYMGSVMGPNDEIYFVPAAPNSTTILKFNTVSETSSNLTIPTSGRWAAGTLAPNGMIYLAPYENCPIVKINTFTNAVTTIGSNYSGYRSAILAPNGKIYCVPCEATTVLKIDPDTDSISTFGSVPANTSKWTGGVLAPNGNIYCAPYDTTTILKINTSNDTVSTFGSFGGAIYRYGPGAVAPNGCLYYASWDSTYHCLLRIDPNNDTFSTIGTLEARGGGSNGIVLGANGLLYIIPRRSTAVYVHDTTIETTSSFGVVGTAGDDKWIGGSLAKNGYIYCAPYASYPILKIGPTGGEGISPSVLLSRYLNKF